MKTRLYYSFMVGTAIAMGNMRGNPAPQNRPAIISSLGAKSPTPAQAASTAADNRPAPSAENQAAPQSGITLIA